MQDNVAVARKRSRQSPGSSPRPPADAAATAAPSGRERLLLAALRQVRNGKIGTVTARSICKEAQITAPTLYHYYGDLHGLYSAVLQRIFELGLIDHPSERDDPIGTIDYVWHKLLDVAERESGVLDLFNQLLASGTIPELMQDTYKRLETAFESLAAQGRLKVDPRLAAEIYWASALGMATLVAATQHGIPYPTGASEVLRKAVLDGIFVSGRQ